MLRLLAAMLDAWPFLYLPPKKEEPDMSGFTLGARSRSELTGVHPVLVRCVETAIAASPQDFSVHDGIRSPAEQKELVARGASKTLNSKHLTQPDGYGHAVDLVPYVNGQLRWEWPLIYPIAAAMAQAAHDLGVRIRWGGDWLWLADEGDARAPDADELDARVNAYVDHRRSRGLSAFIDGPHYEIHPA